MAGRLAVPGPGPSEEYRLLAEAIADLHYAVGLVIESKGELLPGEALEEIGAAWAESQESVAKLVSSLAPTTAPVPGPPLDLASGELVGAPGRAKRSLLSRLRDEFLAFLHSLPRTEEKRVKTAEAGSRYLECGATVVSSIPGAGKVEEVLLLVKQLIDCRTRRSA